MRGSTGGPEQEELGAEAMLSVARTMRKAAKLGCHTAAVLVCICQVVELIEAAEFGSPLIDATLRCRLWRWGGLVRDYGRIGAGADLAGEDDPESRS